MTINAKSDILNYRCCNSGNNSLQFDRKYSSLNCHFCMQDVYFRYSHKQPWILSGTSLVVRHGERIGIIGSNGVGKSTIAKILVGFFRPNQGSVTLFGKTVSWTNNFPDLAYIGDPSYIEDAMALPSDMMVGKLLDMYSDLFYVSGRTLPYASSLGIGLGLQDDRLRGSKIGNLSKGQRQRVLVYLALAKAPMLLVADEATEGLDANSRNLILNEIKRIASERKMTLIWITHRHEEMFSLTESIYELRDGTLVQHKENLFSCDVKVNDSVVTTGSLPTCAIINQFEKLLLLPSTVKVAISAIREKGIALNEG